MVHRKRAELAPVHRDDIPVVPHDVLGAVSGELVGLGLDRGDPAAANLLMRHVSHLEFAWLGAFEVVRWHTHRLGRHRLDPVRAPAMLEAEVGSVRRGSDCKTLGVEMPGDHHLPGALEDSSLLAASEFHHEVFAWKLESEKLLPERKQGSLVVRGVRVLLVEEGPNVAVPAGAALLLGFARRSRAHEPIAQRAGKFPASVFVQPADHHVEILLAAQLATRQCLQERPGPRCLLAFPVVDPRYALFLTRDPELCRRDALPCIQEVTGLSSFSHED